MQLAMCDRLLFMPHTAEGFSKQVHTLLVGIVAALECQRTLVLNLQFSVKPNYLYIDWERLSPELVERIRMEGVSHFINMPHLQALLSIASLPVVGFWESWRCLESISVCHLKKVEMDMEMEWVFTPAKAQLEYSFPQSCELRQENCFAQRRRNVTWNPSPWLTSCNATRHNSQPLCVVGFSKWLEREIIERWPNAGRILLSLQSNYQYAPRYATAAQKFLDEMQESGQMQDHFYCLHWRRDDLAHKAHTNLSFVLDELERATRLHRQSVSYSLPLPLYLMTDVVTERDIASSHTAFRLFPRVDADMLMGGLSVGAIDVLLLEQTLCLGSTIFLGTATSAVSYWIITRRKNSKPTAGLNLLIGDNGLLPT